MLNVRAMLRRFSLVGTDNHRPGEQAEMQKNHPRVYIVSGALAISRIRKPGS